MINKEHYLYFTFATFILLFASCSRGMIQKAYITNPPNVCLFDSAKTNKLKFTGNLRYFENQMSYAYSNKCGLASNALLGFKGQYGADLGWVYYKTMKDKSYFEFVAGYGYFNSHSKATDVGINGAGFLGSDGDYYSQDFKCTYHKLFVQPTISSSIKKTSVAFTLRMSVPFYTNYNTKYDVTHSENDGENNTILEYATAKFKNKFGLTVEPMFSLRFRDVTNKHNITHRWYLQIGACLSPVILKSDSFKVQGKYNYNDEQNFPLHANFFINWGLEFNLAKKNKSKPEGPQHVYYGNNTIQTPQIKAPKKPDSIVRYYNNTIQTNQNDVTLAHALIIHKKTGTKDYKVKSGKRIKLKTKDGRIIKGRLALVKDSSIVIAGKQSIELSTNEISYIDLNRHPVLNHVFGIPLGVMTVLLVVSIEGAIVAFIPGIPAYKLLYSKKCNDTEYDFIIIKARSRYRNFK